ncbi:MAG TPA: serine hydrolase [Candidatus Paceibacterota bacterium]|nr:serine hydrolase [Candidatus Paceibacterota bacterium]
MNDFFSSKVNIIATSLAAILLVIGLGFTALGKNVPVKKEEVAQALNKTATTSPFSNLRLEAQAALVYDPETDRIIFDYQGSKPLPLPSLTKVMTALVASESLPASAVITINEQALATYGESGLYYGEEWLLRDLVDYMLVTSSNDGANAIAQAVERSQTVPFADRMNQRAKSLGLTNSRFYNESGLDISSDQAGAFGSALDVAKLFSYILKTKPSILEATSRGIVRSRTLDDISHVGVNTNDLVGSLAGLRASKTGFTDIANGNLAVVIDRGLRQPVVIVVLGSSQNGRFDDVKKLAEATYAWSLNQ